MISLAGSYSRSVFISAMLGFSAVLGSYQYRIRREAAQGHDGLANGLLFRIDRYLYVQRTGRTIGARTESNRSLFLAFV